MALQFSESWHLLVDWMTEVEQTLDTHKEIASSYEEIKEQLTEQKVQSSPSPHATDIFVVSAPVIITVYWFVCRNSRSF